MCRLSIQKIQALFAALLRLPQAVPDAWLQGRNLEYDGLPVNQALSMGVHESQSLLWERMVGLSKPFAHYLLPQIQRQFPDLAQKLSPDSLYSAVNVLKDPSLIRVEADEVTYPLHIILRCAQLSCDHPQVCSTFL